MTPKSSEDLQDKILAENFLLVKFQGEDLPALGFFVHLTPGRIESYFLVASYPRELFVKSHEIEEVKSSLFPTNWTIDNTSDDLISYSFLEFCRPEFVKNLSEARAEESYDFAEKLSLFSAAKSSSLEVEGYIGNWKWEAIDGRLWRFNGIDVWDKYGHLYEEE